MASSKGLSSSGTSSRGDASPLLLPPLPAAFTLAVTTPAVVASALRRSGLSFTAAADAVWLEADPCLAGGRSGGEMLSCWCCSLCGSLIVAFTKAASTLARLG